MVRFVDDGETSPAVDVFAEFYRGAYPAARRLAHLLLDGAPDAEDVVQDAFTHLHDRFDQLRRPEAYLRRSIVNGCNQLFRSRTRENARLQLVSTGEPDSTSTSEPLLDAVGALPPRQRAAIVLRYWADLDDHSIAAALGSRCSTVRSLIHRGLATLRKDLP